jgi:hypothetical protein
MDQARRQLAEISFEDGRDESKMAETKHRLIRQHILNGGSSADSFIFLRYSAKTALLAA